MRIGIKVSTRRFVLLDADEIYNDWELKLDPPVNSVLPVGRSHLAALKRSLGI